MFRDLGADRRRRWGSSLVGRDSAEPQLFCGRRQQEKSTQASSFLSGDINGTTCSNRGRHLRTKHSSCSLRHDEWDLVSFTLQENQARSEAQNWSNFYYMHIIKPFSVQNSSYIQKLSPLGEAHGVISSLQLWVLGQLTADHGHLLIHIHEKAIFCVLQKEEDETFQSMTGRLTEGPQEKSWEDEVAVLRGIKADVCWFTINIKPEKRHSGVVNVPWRNLCHRHCKYHTKGILARHVDDCLIHILG